MDYEFTLLYPGKPILLFLRLVMMRAEINRGVKVGRYAYVTDMISHAPYIIN